MSRRTYLVRIAMWIVALITTIASWLLPEYQISLVASGVAVAFSIMIWAMWRNRRDPWSPEIGTIETYRGLRGEKLVEPPAFESVRYRGRVGEDRWVIGDDGKLRIVGRSS